MGVLKRINKRKRMNRKDEFEFIGCWIPVQDAKYFHLYCLSRGMSKSHVIKTLVSGWITEKKKITSSEQVLHDMAARAYEVWNNKGGKRIPFPSFRKQLMNDLKFKHLEQFSETIIKLLDDEKTKREGNYIAITDEKTD